MAKKLAKFLAIILVTGLAAIGFSEVFFRPTHISPVEAAKTSLDFLEGRIEKIKSAVDGPSKAFQYGELIEVREVIDGDTIILENNERVRYIGIDTPELDDNAQEIECYAVEATQQNRELVKGKKVRLYKDVSERDRYGRLLAYVYREDGIFVNLELVKNGFGVAATYPPDVEKAELFSVLEREARGEKKGMWGGCI